MIDLTAAYEVCRQLHRRHGRSYYLATRLLPAAKRRPVHALYGFARYTDEIVDGSLADDRAANLSRWADRFEEGDTSHPVLAAVLDTIERFDLDRADFTAFLQSMAMDLTRSAYPSYPDLLSYMDGSAACIGTMMLPILGASDLDQAREPARQLGFAFQLTNFIRDVAEDLDRGRVYLPQEDIDLFQADLHQRVATPQVRELIAFEIGRARAHYRLALPGIDMLHGTSRACIRTAFHLYAAILDEVERADYDVFSRRAAVPRGRRLALAARCLLPIKPSLLR